MVQRDGAISDRRAWDASNSRSHSNAPRTISHLSPRHHQDDSPGNTLLARRVRIRSWISKEDCSFAYGAVGAFGLANLNQAHHSTPPPQSARPLPLHQRQRTDKAANRYRFSVGAGCRGARLSEPDVAAQSDFSGGVGFTNELTSLARGRYSFRRSRIPKPCPVFAGRNQRLAVRREEEVPDVASVPAQVCEFSACFQIPEPHSFIIAA